MNNIRTHYKSDFKVKRTVIAKEKNIFQIIVKQSRSWLKEHYKEAVDQDYIYKPWFFRKGNFEAADSCTEVRTIDYDEATRTATNWSLRFEHNDENYAPRKWRVDITLTCIDDNAAELAVTVSWYLYRESTGEEPSEPSSSASGLVNQLLKCKELSCYKSGKELSLCATELQPGDEREFYEFVISEDRSIPIILMNTQDYGKGIGPKGIQSLFAGSALVYWYDSADVQTALNNEWGQSNVELYHCPSDTIRMYLPHLDTQMDYDWERHPYFSLKEYTGRFHELSRMLKQRILW